MCKIDAGWNALEGADNYSVSVTSADGSVVDQGETSGQGSSVWVPYVGPGTYSVTVTAYGTPPGEEEDGEPEVIARESSMSGGISTEAAKTPPASLAPGESRTTGHRRRKRGPGHRRWCSARRSARGDLRRARSRPLTKSPAPCPTVDDAQRADGVAPPAVRRSWIRSRPMTTAPAELPESLSDNTRDFLDRVPGKLLIGDGLLRALPTAATFATVDPSTGEEICQVAQGGADDVRRAVEAAQAALDGPLKKINPAKRSALM